MANLVYSAIASADGYVEDEQGKFDWGALDEEVHAFVNDLEAARRHPSVRAADVRDDDLLGDRRRSGGGGPGLRGVFGGRPRRLSTPGRFRRCPATKPGSSATSKLRRSSS